MKSLFSKYIWLKLILAVLLLFGGALIIVFAVLGKANVLQSGLNIIAAVILFLFGLFAIIATIVLLEYLVWLLAIFFIVVGGVEIIKGVILLIKKYKPIVAIVVTFIVGTVFVVGGILAIIFNADIRIVFCIIAGALLFLAGVYNLFFGIKEMIAHNKTKEPKKDKKGSKKEEQEEVKELDYTENKDVPVEQ